VTFAHITLDIYHTSKSYSKNKATKTKIAHNTVQITARIKQQSKYMNKDIY